MKQSSFNLSTKINLEPNMRSTSILIRKSLGLWFVLFIAFFTAQANAQQNLVYGNSAGTRGIDVIDADTGAIIRTCAHGKGNGRGVVVIGDIGYYTVASAGTVWKLNVETCEDLGVAFETARNGIATIAYDGTNFWLNQYDSVAPTNGAFEYDFDGNLLRSITLSLCTSHCDGMEYFDGKLISNRGDAAAPIYDIYDLDGNILTEGFINDPQGGSTTGIAYDGVNFWVSDIFANRLRVYDGQTGAFIEFIDITGGATVIEDLSVDYEQRPDIGEPGDMVPVPMFSKWGTTALLFIMIILGGITLRRRISTKG